MQDSRRQPARSPKSAVLLALVLVAATTVLSPIAQAQGAPTVTAVTPNAGALAGGATVTIDGTGFLPGATVTFGSTAAASNTYVSATQVTAVTPAHAAGQVAVTVTNPDTTFGSLNPGYTYEPAPTVSGVSPATGPLSGGTAVTVSGTGFLTGVTVTFGGAAATGITVVSPTSITATTPAHTVGAVSVTVANSDGQSGTRASAFTYVAAPSISSISPSGGPVGGGTPVTITGTNFVSGATVTIGGAPATAVTFVSATSITATAPAHAVGAVNVVVTNPDTQSATLAAGYTYGSGPTVTSVSPNGGPPVGGTSVTVTGTGFVSGATIKFGSAAAGSVVFVSATSLTAVTPANAAGPVAVTVTNPDTQSGSLSAAFTYQNAPTVSSITPIGGPVAGGTDVTITGTGFLAGATVSFGATAATNIVLVSSTSIKAKAPAQAAGAVAVTVTNTDTGAGSLAAGYTYAAAPTITSITPNGGKLAGGTHVTITGTGFTAGTTVKIGGKAATAITFVSPTSIQANTPSHAAGKTAVFVSNADGQNKTLVDGYTYEAAPTITSIYPAGGLVAGNTNVTVQGTGFLAGATVTIGGGAATSIMIVNDTTLWAFTPAHAAGGATLVVTNPDTQSATLAQAYTYSASPSILKLAPNGGALAGSNIVVITGTGFLEGANVTFGGVLGTGNTTLNSFTLLVLAPAHAAGQVTIIVTNPDGKSASLAQGYSFDEAPHLSSVSPAVGSLTGGTAVSIVGSNFKTGTKVTFGTAQATSVVVVDAEHITAATPAHAVGAVAVTVTTPLGLTDSLANAFTYQASAPTLTSVSPTKGSLDGGLSVTLTGTGFAAGATVKFGSETLEATVVSATKIVVVTAARDAGKATIMVTNPDGQQATLTNGFEFAAPAVTTTTSSTTSHAESATSTSATTTHATKGSPTLQLPAAVAVLALAGLVRRRREKNA